MAYAHSVDQARAVYDVEEAVVGLLPGLTLTIYSRDQPL